MAMSGHDDVSWLTGPLAVAGAEGGGSLPGEALTSHRRGQCFKSTTAHHSVQ